MAAERNRIDLNQLNYALVLQVLREQGGASRIELTRRTGLSPATVTGITRDLLEKGYVRPGTLLTSGRGRPSEILVYNADSRYAVGIELHDRTCYGVLTDLYARPVQSHVIAPVGNDADAVVTAVNQWLGDMMSTMGDKECAALGIAIPGAVHLPDGNILLSTEFALSGVPLVALLEERTGWHFSAINRTYAAAMAEVWLGAARDARNVLYVRMGDYLGGSVLIDKLPYLGSGNSGTASIAHIPVDPGGLPCRCGSRGCLDTVASGNAMARHAREEIKRGTPSSMADRTDGNLDLISGVIVVEEAIRGDALAVAVLHTAARWLGIAMGICVNLIGPDTIVFGGTMGRIAGDALIGPVADVARAYIYAMPGTKTQFVTTMLGEEAVACGAAANALWSRLTQSINLHVG